MKRLRPCLPPTLLEQAEEAAQRLDRAVEQLKQSGFHGADSDQFHRSMVDLIDDQKRTPMHTSSQGRDLLIQREALMTIAYPDPKSDLFKVCTSAGISPYNLGYRRLANWQSLSGRPWTIGVGHTGPEVIEGLEWSLEKCKQVFAEDLDRFEKAVNDCVTVPLEQHQFDALVSFSHNCGVNALAHGNNGEPSSILLALNAGDYDAAGHCFNNWMADPEVRTRRAGERDQFLGLAFEPRRPA